VSSVFVLCCAGHIALSHFAQDQVMQIRNHKTEQRASQFIGLVVLFSEV
jgi:hypothetical protein